MMKVLIDNEWQEYDVVFGAPHPDGGIIIQSERLRNRCSRHILCNVNTIIVVVDEESVGLLCFTTTEEGGGIVFSAIAELSPHELHTYFLLMFDVTKEGCYNSREGVGYNAVNDYRHYPKTSSRS